MYITESSEIIEVIYEDVRTGAVEMGRVERMVDIYESADTVGFHNLRTNTETHQPLQHTGSVSVKNRKPRAAEVCLCLLCFLLLTAVLVLCVHFTIKRNQLQTHIKKLTEEREQMHSKYELILSQNNNLTEDREQIHGKYELILAQNNNLTKERKLILNKIAEIQRGLYEQELTDKGADSFKWIRYSFSFYYISSEKKSWSHSRQNCLQRGADLLTIDSKEEQKFFQKIAVHDDFWIGLRKTKSVWKWIDGTTMVNGYWNFWSSGSYSNCATMISSGWMNQPCSNMKKWICKKRILKSPIT